VNDRGQSRTDTRHRTVHCSVKEVDTSPSVAFGLLPRPREAVERDLRDLPALRAGGARIRTGDVRADRLYTELVDRRADRLLDELLRLRTGTADAR
jgi:hypothetical protein